MPQLHKHELNSETVPLPSPRPQYGSLPLLLLFIESQFWCIWSPCPIPCFLTSNLVWFWYDTHRRIRAMERGHRLLWTTMYLLPYRPYYPTTRIRSTLPFTVLAPLPSDRSGTLSDQPPQVESGNIRPLRLQSTTDHKPHCRLVSSDKAWRRSTISAWCLLENMATTALAKWNKNWFTYKSMQTFWNIFIHAGIWLLTFLDFVICRCSYKFYGLIAYTPFYLTIISIVNKLEMENY